MSHDSYFSHRHGRTKLPVTVAHQFCVLDNHPILLSFLPEGWEDFDKPPMVQMRPLSRFVAQSTSIPRIGPMWTLNSINRHSSKPRHSRLWNESAPQLVMNNCHGVLKQLILIGDLFQSHNILTWTGQRGCRASFLFYRMTCQLDDFINAFNGLSEHT